MYKKAGTTALLWKYSFSVGVSITQDILHLCVAVYGVLVYVNCHAAVWERYIFIFITKFNKPHN